MFRVIFFAVKSLDVISIKDKVFENFNDME